MLNENFSGVMHTEDDAKDYYLEDLTRDGEPNRYVFQSNKMYADVTDFDESFTLGEGVLDNPIDLPMGRGAYLDFTPFGDDVIHPEKLTETFVLMFKGITRLIEVIPDIDYFYGNTNPRMAQAMKRFGFSIYDNKQEGSEDVYYFAEIDAVRKAILEFEESGLKEKLIRRQMRDAIDTKSD